MAEFREVNLSPVAYGLLIVSSIVLALSLFSLFRIPIFHYLFKMVHLWLVILCGLLLFLYFKYGHMLTEVTNAAMPQKIAEIFPGAHPEIFKPLVILIQDGLNNLSSRVIIVFMTITIGLAVIQIILYMPSSLRYVYYTHISPFKYTLKHILVSVLLLAPLLLLANYLFKQDTSINPKLDNLLTLKQENVDDRENTFFPMLTMWIPEVPDRVSYGKNWLSQLKKMLAYFKNRNTPVDLAQYPDYRELALGGMSKVDQAAINQLYIQRLPQDNARLDAAIAKYIQKYQAPLQIARTFDINKQYQNRIDYTDLSYTTFYSNYSGSFLSLQRLNLLVSLIDPGTTFDSLARKIRANYYFNLNVIKQSNDPNVKLLHIDKQDVIVQFLYNLLNNPKFQTDKIYKLINHLPGLPKSAMDQKLIAKNKLQLIKEQLIQANSHLSGMQSVTADFIRYTYKYNKTLNCIFDRATRVYNLDNQEISEHISRQNTKPTKASLNNVIGNQICKANIPDSKVDLYIKAVETNGRLMILKARSNMYEEKINIFNIATYLNNHSAKYFNPFSGKPLSWDRDMHEIYFEYNDGKQNVRVSY